MRVGNVSLGFPKPRGAVLGLLLTVFFVWLTLALALNWGGASAELVVPLLGNSHAVLHGQVWRLFTAPLIHQWAGDAAVSHMVTTVIVLYFFGPALQERWGNQRFLLFALATAVFGFICQTLVGSMVDKLDQPVWFGGLAMVDAIVIAWALQADPSQRVLLFFVLPVSPTMILVITIGLNVLKLIAQGTHFEGLVSPFGGMLAGWMLSDRSPLRRSWLRLRLRRLEHRAAALKSTPGRSRVAAHGLRVIRGGADEEPKDKHSLN